MTAFALFSTAFLAATLVPMSSEVALSGAILAGVPAATALIACSLGNTLACLLNYGLGYWAGHTGAVKALEGRGGMWAKALSERTGRWALTLSWLPVVGDPITVLAGVSKVDFALFATVVPALRVARYLAIAYFLV